MSWEAIGTFALVAVSFAGLNVGALRWMLDRNHEEVVRDFRRFEEIERALLELRAALPLEYVRREDWIRFSGTLDAKLDGMRDELREEIGAIKEKLYV
jgi:hypothetical protein